MMLNFKKISLLVAVAISCAGCMEQKIMFNFNKDVNQNFFKEIPGIGDAKFIKFPVTHKATSAEVYVASFRERFLESDNLLEFTELNDDSKIHAADYWYVNGYSQNLYLIKFEFTYSIKNKNGKETEIPTKAVVFFSIKQNGRGNTLGIMPCYFGIVDEDEDLISFNTELSLKKNNGKYYLKLLPAKKNMNGLIFMPAAFPENPLSADNKFNIEKIVNLDANKVGGYKPLVFDIGNIFKDTNALSFHYVDTLHLIQ